jgi:hypothetical protein
MIFFFILEVFEQYDVIPTITNGIRNGEYEVANPLSVAVFDFYHGTQIMLKESIPINNHLYVWQNKIYNMTQTIIKMGIADSIFKKVSSKLYKHCF